MIWIKNHGVRGQTDNLRQPLKDAGLPICCHNDEGETTPVIFMKGWTGLALDDHDISDDELTQLLKGLNPIIVVAHEQDAEHDEFDNKSDELDAYYNDRHPDE